MSSISGFGFNQGGFPSMSPQEMLQQYMQQNGVSEAEAKEQLKQLYGDPQKPQEADGNAAPGDKQGAYEVPDAEDEDYYAEVGEDYDYTQLSPEEAAQLYADVHGITIDEAIKELEGKYGAPEEPDDVTATDTGN